MTNSPSGRRQDPFPVSGPADILAFIPHSLGFVPRESLVFMTVDSSRLGATLRLDLPAQALDYSDFAARVSGILRSDPTADGVLMALYTDRSWKEPGTPPYRRLITQLGRSLADTGLPIRDGWMVSAHTWREYFCEDSSCCPWPGHPLRDITNSTLSAEMVYRGSAFARSLDEAVAMDLPPLWSEAATQAAGHGAAYARRLKGRWCGYSQFAGTLAVWDRFLSNAAMTSRGGGGSGPHHTTECGSPLLRTDPEAAGFLLASLHVRPVRDTLLVMAALGREPALSGADACGLLSNDSRRPLVPPRPEYPAGSQPSSGGPAGTGASVPGSTPAEVRPSGSSGWGRGLLRQQPKDAGLDFRDVLVGQYSSTLQWRGIDAAFAVLSELLAAADQGADTEATAALLSLMGWIEWARGRGSRAQVYLTRSLDAKPGYRLAVLLEELLATGHFPVWARNAGTAWKGSSIQEPGAARS